MTPLSREPVDKKSGYPEYARLVELMARLRAPGGCPWDRSQSREDLKTYLVEETYEVLDAIDSKSSDKLKEELGDLLLQIVFHAEIAEEENAFDIEDVCRSINEKLVRRHPHVFGDAKAETPDIVLKNWETIKKGEKEGKSALGGVPKVLPALLKAYRLQEKAARVGFDWEETRQVEAKVDEELAELREATENGDREKIREELGDLLFAIVNLSRFLKLDPEDTLQSANEKFIRRFKAVEKSAADDGRDLHGMSLAEMDQLWEEAKKKERSES
ncbi:MAG TPA: nucleoside triphosphate pyrophosphohydrolase [Acidobacteriota bacterium]|nr:nucleoside triphosphate pyrophosphohydrolase [Acidobacteriota bacterium]